MKYNLTDMTFLILIRLDTIERLENVLATTEFLSSNFDTTINVLECSSFNNGVLKKMLKRKINYVFQEDFDPILYRTKYLNQMIREIKTLFVAVWDADVIVSKSQVIDAVELLRNKTGDFVYPYNDFFLDTSEIIKKLYLKKKDIRILFKNRKKMKEMYRKPVGGVFFCNLDVYIDSGLENEQFYGWGVEDGDRYLRWTNSGYKIERTEEPLFHLSHPRGINSFIHNPDQSIIKLKELNAARCTTSKKKFS